jgi:hypothetical protein
LAKRLSDATANDDRIDSHSYSDTNPYCYTECNTYPHTNTESYSYRHSHCYAECSEPGDAGR